MSSHPEPGGGLLGPLDAAFAGLRADDVADSADREPTGVGEAVDVRGHDLEEGGTLRETSTIAPHRIVDPQAQAIADRLLGRPGDLVVWRLVDERDRATVVGRAIVLGRGEANDRTDVDGGRDRDDVPRLVVPLAVVSRRHCRVELDGDQPVVRDLGSSNGTFIVRDDAVITVGDAPVGLQDGDVLATAGGRRRLVSVERTGAVR